jgi:hypothetical protein
MATIARRADMRIRGTRPTSAGPPPRTGGAPPSRTGYSGSRIWPGITTGLNASCSCTWATFDGQYQVKFRDALCITHPRSGAQR